MLYRDHGLDIYGNGIAASLGRSSRTNPDAVKGFIRATIKGVTVTWRRDPELAAQMTVKFESLLNADIERDRLKLAMSCCIVTPNVLKKRVRRRRSGAPETLDLRWITQGSRSSARAERRGNI